MINFIDGPAAGQTLDIRRSPIVLRVVVGPRGKLDALDQLEDVAAANETIHVYRLASRVDRVHVCARGKGGKALSGVWPIASYRYMPEQPAEEHTRDNAAWNAWCAANEQRIRAEAAADGAGVADPIFPRGIEGAMPC